MAQQKQSGGPPQAIDYNEIEQPGMSSREYAFNQYEPQTKFGVKLAQQRFGQQKKSGLSRGEAFVNDQGQRVVPLYDKQTGRKVKTVVLGKTQQNEDQWSEPYKKGNQWLQKNLKTNKVRKAYQQGGGEPSAKEKEIQRYLDNDIAKTRQQAIKLAEGQYALGQDALGNSVIFDMTTGEVVRPLSGPGEQQQQSKQQKPRQGQEREPFLTVEETQEGVGPVSSIKQMMNNIIGPFKPGQLFADTEQARNKLRMFRQRIKPYLMVSSRGAVYEQQNIEEFLPNPDQFFTDPDASKDQLQNLYGMINSTIEKKQELIDQGDITADQRKTFVNDIRKLQTALSYLPDEERLFSAESGGQGDIGNLTIQDIQAMSAQDLQSLDVDQLNQAQTRAALQRLEQIEQGGQ
jgi:hypothetical protein